jgi:hypothetical protein
MISDLWHVRVFVLRVRSPDISCEGHQGLLARTITTADLLRDIISLNLMYIVLPGRPAPRAT